MWVNSLCLQGFKLALIKYSVGSVIGADTTKFYDSVRPRVGGRKELQLHLKNKKVYLADKSAQRILQSKGITCAPQWKTAAVSGNEKLLGRTSA